MIDDALPMYHGPISTSLAKEVAMKFSENEGLIWKIEPNYENKFRFITGIKTEWITQYSNEEEFLLVNQYLPIVKTTNFDNNVENCVSHLLYSLLSHTKQINKPETFYKVIGVHYKAEWMSVIENSRNIIYKMSPIPSTTILERLHKE